MDISGELNILVAKWIMGWKPFQKQWKSGIHEGTNDSWLDENNIELYGNQLPSFSTDLGASWEVVKKMQKKGFRFYLDASYDGECEATFSAGDSNCSHDKQYDPLDGHGYTYAEAESSSPSEAICLAALKALNCEKPVEKE